MNSKPNSYYDRDDLSPTTSLEVGGCVSNSYPAGIELFSQGSIANSVYFVQRGLLKLFRCESTGQRVLLALKCQGSLIGAAAAVQDKPHLLSAVTGTSCTLIRWDSHQFLSLTAQDHSLSLRVQEILSAELDDYVSRISQIACLPARQRLEHFLWQLSEQFDCSAVKSPGEWSTKLQVPLIYSELAELLSITPTYLCRLFKVLETENVIRRQAGWIVVRQPSNLWHSLS